ncbi:MAG TPA: maleylpyruvate isomerase N-terminal domain-containing protein [Dehalococcoidia bacterium]|nr:maleylpyruvate isomerase N-terminal domain-containing protein [Dehalococcoidia bacterium]
MATRSELVDGYRFLIQEARRISGALSPADWALAVDQDGWKGTEVLAHVAGVGTVVVPMVTALLNAPDGASPLNMTSIDALNAGLVGARAGRSPAELAEEVAQSYGGVIEWVTAAGDDVLAKRVTAGGHRDVALSDVLMRMTILHGVGHIYSVYGAVFFG